MTSKRRELLIEQAELTWFANQIAQFAMGLHTDS